MWGNVRRAEFTEYAVHAGICVSVIAAHVPHARGAQNLTSWLAHRQSSHWRALKRLLRSGPDPPAPSSELNEEIAYASRARSAARAAQISAARFVSV